MLEDEVKEFVNKIIKREHGKEIDFDDLLTDSELDSFGYIILTTELEDKYKCFMIFEEEIDYETYRLITIVETIKAHYAQIV